MRKVDLYTHCGSNRVSREQMRNSITPPASDSHVPIPHTVLWDKALSAFENSGYKLENEAHALNREGQQYFGLMQLGAAAGGDGASLIGNGHDASLIAGVRNSHDKRFPAALVLGSQVFVCDNLAFSGEVKVATRHTRYILDRLDRVVGDAVGKLADHRIKLEERHDLYKSSELSHGEVNDLVIEAMDRNVLPPTKIPQVMEEWRNPRHPEFKVDGQTGWRLYNAFTESLKGSSLNLLSSRTQRLHGILDKHLTAA